MEQTGANSQLYDVIIVGGGPAGLSAAIYIARARYKVLVMEKEKIGGQITITSEIVNYPGVESTSGKALTSSMKDQAEAFGAEFAMGEVLDMDLTGDVKVLHTTRGELRALGVVLATGANPRKLGFKGEKEFQGRGVAYCATCDGEFFTGMEVFVIGGGFAAVEEGIFLTKYASHVTMIVREGDFTCAKTVSDQIYKEEKISVHFHTEIAEVAGDSMVTYARFRNNETNEEWEHRDDQGFGVFVFAGYVPNTKWLPQEIEVTPQGYLVTDARQKTNLDGVYGAGDVCLKDLRQVVTAVSDGAVAATSLEKHVSVMHEKLGIPELERNEARMDRLRKPGAEKGVSAAGGETHEGTAQDSQGFLSPQIREQLAGLFPRFENRVRLVAVLDDSPLAGETANFLGELEGLSDKLICEKRQADPKTDEGKLLPALELWTEDGVYSGICFHGVPGGHEFNSFVIAMYNVAGPGQQIDDSVRTRIQAIDRNINVKILISLSCTMCPEVVMAAQRAASLSGNIQAELVDLMHYPELKEQYKVMSVPCMVVNDSRVYFGKKNLDEVTKILEEAAKEG